MHIQKVHLKNIRSFENLEIDFGNSGAGWHVILGTNGTGKSTLIRSIALALVGSPEVAVLGYKQSWKSWLRQGFDSGKIEVHNNIPDSLPLLVDFDVNFPGVIAATAPFSFFSAGYGSLRRLTGGNPDYKNIWENHPKLAAHLSVFGEDIALDQSLDWLEDLLRNNTTIHIRRENEENENFILYNIIFFINNSELLPNEITIKLEAFLGIRFIDKSGLKLLITELSDGYRSILALVLELLRQLCKFHDNDITKIFNSDQTKIITEGVVLIDEIDAHLHPTWQAKIGEWFTEYFPNIQFIVTTHSPIICRSADTGTIWKLSNEGKSTQIKQIEGIEKKQLLYGNILDAFETDLFGEDISRSEESKEMLKEMAVLNVKRQVGRISKTEETRLEELEQIFQTDAQDNFLDD
jgi:energy-coupling factor transporter ATP-binding protein EcfA2